MHANISLLLGTVLGIVSVLLVFVNTTVMYCIIKERMYAKRSPIYLIAASNLFIDNAMLLLHGLYFAPTIIFESYFFEAGLDDWRTIFFSSCFMVMWYGVSISQILMALNRVVVMCFSTYAVFTLRNTKIFVAMVYPISFTLAVLSQYVLPCCRFSFNYRVFSYVYIQIGNLTNYPNYYIDLPLNSASSLVCIICYGTILFWIRSFGSNISKSSPDCRRQRMEIKYAFQFSLISLFYLIVWTSFRMFPVLINLSSSAVAYFIICPISMALSCGANGLVYLISNSEIKSVLLKLSTTVSSDGLGSSNRNQIYQPTANISQVKVNNE